MFQVTQEKGEDIYENFVLTGRDDRPYFQLP